MALISIKENLNEQVFQSLKEMIIMGKLKPGEKIIETNLSKVLNTSRTPIRDALRRLERENLVIMPPSRGAQVTKLSKKTIINLYECRAALEGLAISQAVEHIDKESMDLIEESIFLAEHYYSKGDMEKTVEKNTFFHEQFVELSNNIPLIQMMESIKTQILRYRILTSSVGFRGTFLEEHKEILEAVKNKKNDLAESMMRKHILDDLQTFLEGLENSYLDN
ncbi:GntR family transcriptional regulator [Psychrobacillus sp. OK032]|uniref:GntR family transcriptional regulator n=1 Tax=Psychrobacillus sp. OK032 TaxID=1884358 RepID=UPI0008B20CDB|nr:GntR family transcriptional regulator [Psychrobacillus sp. OK032]SES34791.1 transcriptional regulator, GntR family [Psychrobacillus sp. OK032]